MSLSLSWRRQERHLLGTRVTFFDDASPFGDAPRAKLNFSDKFFYGKSTRHTVSGLARVLF